LQIAEVVCIGADVLANYDTSNKLLLFLLVFHQTPLGLIMRLKKTGLAWVFKSLILVFLVAETTKMTKRRLI
jgi:hypothetical protein